MMNIKSLGYRTDFIFHKYDGQITDEGDYFLIKSESNPNHFWGNFLLYKKPPTLADHEKWKVDFKRNFPNAHHMTFGWDCINGEQGEAQNFVNEEFKLDRIVVFTTNHVIKPPKFNSNIEIKVIEAEAHYDDVLEIQVRSADNHLSKEA